MDVSSIHCITHQQYCMYSRVVSMCVLCMLTCCQSSNLVLSLSGSSAVLGCVPVSLPVLGIPWVLCQTAWRVLRSQTGRNCKLCCCIQCIVESVGDIVNMKVVRHLWAFSLHSNHKGHAVSACLWFRNEAISISCPYCNAHSSHRYCHSVMIVSSTLSLTVTYLSFSL